MLRSKGGRERGEGERERAGGREREGGRAGDRGREGGRERERGREGGRGGREKYHITIFLALLFGFPYGISISRSVSDRVDTSY